MVDSRVLIAIAIMALVTYFPRMLPLAVFRHKIENRFIQSFLYYVPYAVLSAMTFPAIFTSTGSVGSACVALLVALVLAFHGRSLLTVALGAVGTAYLVELFLRLSGAM